MYNIRFGVAYDLKIQSALSLNVLSSPFVSFVFLGIARMAHLLISSPVLGNRIDVFVDQRIFMDPSIILITENILYTHANQVISVLGQKQVPVLTFKILRL